MDDGFPSGDEEGRRVAQRETEPVCATVRRCRVLEVTSVFSGVLFFILLFIALLKVNLQETFANLAPAGACLFLVDLLF